MHLLFVAQLQCGAGIFSYMDLGEYQKMKEEGTRKAYFPESQYYCRLHF